MKEVELNLTRLQLAGFIDWLANDGYWGHTLSDLDLSLGEEETLFVINGHKLSNYSARQHLVVIDGHYIDVRYPEWIDEAVSQMGL